MAHWTIYHITRREAWEAARADGVYVADSLAAQGFIHASTREQVVATADRLYAGRDGLVLLCIDPARLKAPLRREAVSEAGGGAMASTFPHIYGPLNLDAVTRVVDFPAGEDGRFGLPRGLLEAEARDVTAEPRQVTIRATNFDGSFHWGHPAWLLRADDAIVVTGTEAGLRVDRGDGGEYVSPYNTRAHYWPDRWFNVIRLEIPGKGLYGYYCNIATPMDFNGATVRYVDLQLDVRVFADAAGNLTHRLMDEDEFAAARRRYAYPEELVSRCRDAVDEVIRMVEVRRFPFDG